MCLQMGRSHRSHPQPGSLSQNVSWVSAVGGVRTAMVAAQRKIGAQGGVVMDGRDISTVQQVFPGGTEGILTASWKNGPGGGIWS